MMNTAAMRRSWAVTGSVQLSSPPAAHEFTMGAGAGAAGASAPVMSAICMRHPRSCHHSSPRAAVLCFWRLRCCQRDRIYCFEPSGLTSMTGRCLLEECPPFYAPNAWSAVRRLHFTHHRVSVLISGYTTKYKHVVFLKAAALQVLQGLHEAGHGTSVCAKAKHSHVPAAPRRIQQSECLLHGKQTRLARTERLLPKIA